ncbi:MAG: MaoC/PaaZ C-terminal domain-containing protein [Bdellovibrionota bacterium]
MKPIFFEDIELNKVYSSGERVMTDGDIKTFAELSGDFNPLHMDDAFAKANLFGQRIAHGLLGLSIASGLKTDEPPLHILAFKEVSWKFKRPIFIGDKIHLETKAIEKTDARMPGTGDVLVERKLINQDGKVTQEGIFTLLVKKKS